MRRPSLPIAFLAALFLGAFAPGAIAIGPEARAQQDPADAVEEKPRAVEQVRGGKIAPLLSGLGSYHREVSTNFGRREVVALD
jgi:hypothetical protein